MGLGTDEEEALERPKKVPKGGDSSAQRRLGVALEHGEFGLGSSAEEVLKWHQMAADSGNFAAQRRLAQAYEGGGWAWRLTRIRR